MPKINNPIITPEMVDEVDTIAFHISSIKRNDILGKYGYWSIYTNYTILELCRLLNISQLTTLYKELKELSNG